VEQQCNCRYRLCIDMVGTAVCVMGKTESVEKSGLGGCEMEDRRGGGRGSSSSYVSSDA